MKIARQLSLPHLGLGRCAIVQRGSGLENIWRVNKTGQARNQIGVSVDKDPIASTFGAMLVRKRNRGFPDNVIGMHFSAIAPRVHRTIIQQVSHQGYLMQHNEQRTPQAVFIKRGFNRIEAASYVGISPTKFDQLVEDGRMPKAKQIDGRKVWDVRELDPAFEDLGNRDGSWDNLK